MTFKSLINTSLSILFLNKTKLLSESIKTFKIFATSTVIYSAYIIISQIVNLVQTYFNIADNPLMPKYLLKYMAFPAFFIVPFFSVLGIISYKQLKYTALNEVIILICFGFAFAYFLFGIHIYELLQSFNPYGSVN